MRSNMDCATMHNMNMILNKQTPYFYPNAPPHRINSFITKVYNTIQLKQSAVNAADGLILFENEELPAGEMYHTNTSSFDRFY